MSSDQVKRPSESKRKARRRIRSALSIELDREAPRPSPTARLVKAKDEHIKWLEEERRRLLEKVDKLQAMVDWLAPENARLKEAVGDAVAKGIVATWLVAIGVGAICFATFVAGASRAVASAGVALLMAGVVVLVFAAFRGPATKSPPPS